MNPVAKAVPYVCFGIAAAVAVLFAFIDDAATKHALASSFAPLLGLALAFWGFEEIHAGEIRGKRRYVTKSERPILFWLIVGFRRFIPGMVLIPAGFWLYVSQGP